MLQVGSLFVFKSEVQAGENKIRLFTIFFQRWYDSEVVYHSAGHYGTHMFLTCGGTCLIKKFKSSSLKAIRAYLESKHQITVSEAILSKMRKGEY